MSLILKLLEEKNYVYHSKKNLNINLEEIINEIAKKIMLIGIAEAKKMYLIEKIYCQ